MAIRSDVPGGVKDANVSSAGLRSDDSKTGTEGASAEDSGVTKDDRAGRGVRLTEQELEQALSRFFTNTLAPRVVEAVTPSGVALDLANDETLIEALAAEVRDPLSARYLLSYNDVVQDLAERAALTPIDLTNFRAVEYLRQNPPRLAGASSPSSSAHPEVLSVAVRRLSWIEGRNCGPPRSPVIPRLGRLHETPLRAFLLSLRQSYPLGGAGPDAPNVSGPGEPTIATLYLILVSRAYDRAAGC